MTGIIDEHWHLYSKLTPKNAGPVPIQIDILKSKDFKVKSHFKEKTSPKKYYDSNFESEVFVFENKFEASSKIKRKRKRNVTFEGTITYMVCDETMCLPPIDKPFKIQLK